jgi:hypothetical protein
MRSLCPSINNNHKLDQLRCILNKSNKESDIVGITGTWFNGTYRDSTTNINGYSQYRNDRHNNKGGGIAVYVKDNISCSRRTDLENSDSIESLWLEIMFTKSPSILICTAYRQPEF